MNPNRDKRWRLVDALFGLILLSAAAWDLRTRGWSDVHGGPFTIGLVSVAFIGIADRMAARLGSRSFLIALVCLAALPTFELACAGGSIPLGAYVILISCALYFSIRNLVTVDRFQGICLLVIVAWALMIGLSNVLTTGRSYTGFWQAGII